MPFKIKQILEEKKKRDIFEKLTPWEKSGLFLWPSVAGKELTTAEKELFETIKPSGVVLFKRNLKEFHQSQKLISELKTLCHRVDSILDFPFLVAIDEEGGRVSRLPLPHKPGLAALHFSSTENKNALIQQITNQCHVAQSLGINCFLAPVVDIFSEPENQVIGDRAFGRDAKTVIEYASIAFDVMLDQNIYPCIKHFPGHGATVQDSHKEMATADVKKQVLYDRELQPFQYFIQRNTPFLMTAHVQVPCIDPSNPATLSKNFLQSILRQRMGYQGYVLSDDLRMNAIAHHYGVGKKQDADVEELQQQTADSASQQYLKQAAQDALKAGCDIILSCQSIVEEAPIYEFLAEQIDAIIEAFG